MKTRTAISIITACAFALTAGSAMAQGQGGQRGAKAEPPQRAQVERGQRDMDRDRLQDRDRINEPQQDRDQDRTNAPEQAKFGDSEIYGQELMSVQERNQYREQLRLTESDPEAQAKLKAQHEEQMRIRAKEQGVTRDEPGQDNGKQ